MTAAATDTAGKAVAKIEPQMPGILGDIQRMQPQFALALPEHVSPERYVRVVITAVRTNPDLMRADRESLLSAAMKCAQDGLLPDGREAALVCYGGKAQYLPMIAGILTKVRRSGDLLTISAQVAYEKDAFTYVLGDEERIEHQPYLEGARGKPIAAYAVAKTKDGGVYREVMSIEEIERVRAVSKAKNNGPWVAWWGEMARKTVLRRLSKRLPMSTDLQQVFARDDDHYELRQASGAARLRRLHADFDEPSDPVEPAVEIPPDVIEGEVVAPEAAADSPPAAESPAADNPVGGDDDTFPGDKPAFDVLQWASDLNRRLPEYDDVDVLRADWCEHKAELQEKSPGLFKETNKAVAARAAEIAAKAVAE